MVPVFQPVLYFLFFSPLKLCLFPLIQCREFHFRSLALRRSGKKRTFERILSSLLQSWMSFSVSRTSHRHAWSVWSSKDSGSWSMQWRPFTISGRLPQCHPVEGVFWAISLCSRSRTGSSLWHGTMLAARW